MAATKKAKSKAKKKAPAKKRAAKKAAAPRKKPAVKKAAAKKTAAKKAAAKRPAAKKSVVKKAAPKKPAAKPVAAKPAPKPAVIVPPQVRPATPPPSRPAAATHPAQAAQPPQPATRPWEPPKPVVTLSAVAIAPRGTPQSNAATPEVPEHSPLPGEDPVGVVTHYYNHLSVAVVHLDAGSLEVGDMVRIIGHTTDFRQKVTSLEVDHHSVTEVGRRQAFGMKVNEHVREHDVVYKVNEF